MLLLLTVGFSPAVRAGDTVPTAIPAGMEARVRRAEALEAAARDLLRAGKVADAETKALEAIARKESALGRDHPRMGAALLTLADIQLARLSGADGDRFQQAVGVPRQREGPLLALYDRGIDGLEAMRGSEDRTVIAACLVAARIRSSFHECAAALRYVKRALDGLGDANDEKARALRRIALDTLYLEPWRTLRNAYLIAFAGLTRTVWDLEDQALRHLAAVEETQGAESVEAFIAREWLVFLLLGRPERAEAAYRHAERAAAIYERRSLEAPPSPHLHPTLLRAIALADFGDVERFEKTVDLSGFESGLIVAASSGPAKQFIDHIQRDLATLQATVRQQGADSAAGLTALDDQALNVAIRWRDPLWGEFPRGYVLELARDTLELRRAKYGAKSPEAADGHAVLASIEYVCGLHEEAEASAEACVRLRRKRRRKDPAGLADAHALAGYVHCARWDLAAAARHFESARKLLFRRHRPVDVAGFRAAVNLASVRKAEGDYAGAHAVLDAALSAFLDDDALRADHVATRWHFDPVQSLLESLGRFRDLERVADALPVPGHESLHSPAGTAHIRGDYREAARLEREYYERVQSAHGQQYGARNYDWAVSRLRRARALLDAGAEDEALADLLEVTQSFEEGDRANFFPPRYDDREGLLLAFEALSEALLRRGQTDQAVALGERAYALHTEYAHVTSQQVPPRVYDRLELLFVEPLLARRAAALPPLASRAPELFARAKLESGDVEGAVQALEGALAELRPRVPRGHPRLAYALQALARIEIGVGRVAAARGHAEEAHRTLAQVVGEDHPDVADIRITLGDVALLQDEPAKARAHYDAALGVFRETLYPTHLNVALALSGTAVARMRAGKPDEALAPMREALQLISQRIDSSFVGATPKERVQMLAAVQWVLGNWIEVTAAAGVPGYAEVLHLKARVSRSMALEHRLLRRATGKARDIADELDRARRRLAHIAHRAPRYGWRRLGWRRDVAEATRRVDDLTQALSRAFRDYAKSQGAPPVRVKDLMRALKRGEALVDVLLTAGRFVAWVVAPSEAPVRVELGAAADLTARLQAFRDAVMKADTPTDEAWKVSGRALRRAFWAQLVAALPDGLDVLYLVPDGPLAATPLEALPLGGGYLVDHVRLVRLASATDLLPPPVRPRTGSGVLLVGNVNFEWVQRDTAGAPTVTGKPMLRDRVPGLPRFGPLPGSAAEVLLVDRAFEKAHRSEKRTTLEGGEASETRLRETIEGRRVVHLATHGFVRENLDARLRVPADEVFRLRAGLERHARRFDPFLMSGLALAGVNARVEEGDDDGMLTALEILGFDLGGVELAFLSACETARGIEQAGEGVLGLVRAFTVAGSQHVVASLWPVSDEPTVEVVRRFYAAWLKDGRSAPADAMRTAVIGVRDETKHVAPRHWAAFGVYGPLR